MTGDSFHAALRSGGSIRAPSRIRKPRIEIIPLIDVMFFLLASFMLVSLSMQKVSTKGMDLAVASTARDDFKPSALNVVVDSNGLIFLGTNQVSGGQLDAALGAAFKAHSQTPIFVTSGKETPFAQVDKALVHIRSAGFQHVSLVTKPASNVGAPR